MSGVHRLRIDRAWDGAPVPPAARVRVALRPLPDALEIRCAARLFGGDGPPAPPGATDRLWEHEVVEVFVAGPDGRYTEIELGPYGNHLVLQLASYRSPVASGLPLVYRSSVRSGPAGRTWTGIARVDRGLLPTGPHRVNAYAIQPTSEGRRYLAWSPPGGAAPDFHRVESFRPLPLS